jgi:3-phenylpropionate/cinnamic acid dioxygenase small subunit
MNLSADEHAEITNLYHRYAHAFDGADGEAWSSLFTREGRFIPPGVPDVVGTDALRQFVSSRAQDTPGMRHLFANVVVAPTSEDRADGISYFLCFRLGGDGEFRLRNIGRYEDELAREEGAWKIARRRVVSDLPAELVDAAFTFAAA